jgi:site-specific DNA recombinase
VRGLIEQVTVRIDSGGEVTLDLEGALTAMLDLAQPGAVRGLSERSVKVVAGVGFEPTTFRL